MCVTRPRARAQVVDGPSDVAVPFRLTPNVQRLATPFGIDGGPFAGAFGAVAECLAQTHKCPLSDWLGLLSRPDETDRETSASTWLPWSASGAEATERAKESSPEIHVTCLPKGRTADVHARVRALVAEATDEAMLQAMPSAWQAWL